MGGVNVPGVNPHAAHRSLHQVYTLSRNIFWTQRFFSFFFLKILTECDWRWSVFCSNLVVGALEHLRLVDKEEDSSPIPSLLFPLSLSLSLSLVLLPLV